MKKNLFFAIPVLSMVFLLASCLKSDPGPAASQNGAQGNWVGTFTNSPGGPANFYGINLKSNGAIVVSSNSATTPNIANGTWSLVADSVKATYTYVGGSATYSLAGKYSSTSNIMIGTIGVGTTTSGEAVFSVTKE